MVKGIFRLHEQHELQRGGVRAVKWKIKYLMRRLGFFPFSELDDVTDKMSQTYPVLAKYRNKIIIKQRDALHSEISYKKERDIFEITINNGQNFRHRSIDLFHELAHAAGHIETFQRDVLIAEKGIYASEKEAFELELGFLKPLSEDLYRTVFAQVLSSLVRVLFEISLYTNPNQDPNRLFAETFNRCFVGAKQKTNPLYLLEERLLYRPFASLPHAVANSMVILEGGA